MNAYANWFAENERYVKLLVQSLIARLEGHLKRYEELKVQPAAMAKAPPPAVASFRAFGLFSRPEQALTETVTAPRIEHENAAEHGDDRGIEAKLAALEAMPLPPALRILQQRFSLTDFERQTLLLCAALEFDADVSTLCARLSHATGQSAPSFALALSLFEDPSWDAISSDRPLRYWHLLEIVSGTAQPVLTSALRADERIVGYLRGLAQLDARLSSVVIPVRTADNSLPPSQESVVSAGTGFVQSAVRAGRSSLIQLAGADAQSKLDVAIQVSNASGLNLFRLGAECIPTHVTDLETFARLWQRECLLMPVALYIDASAADRSPGLGSFLGKLATHGAVVFVDTNTQASSIARDALTLEVRKPTPQEQRDYWTSTLDPAHANLAAPMAAQFNFNLATIREIVREVAALGVQSDGTGGKASTDTGAGSGEGRVGAAQADQARNERAQALWRACLRRARPSLDQLAQLIETRATWNDLELPAAERALLKQIVEQTRGRLVVYDDWGFRERTNRGLGISALFAGDSGTGKTLAAEVIANELSLLLYRIDLSAVVSKYIGDTERNLKRLFDAAEDGGAILFFDEADALFGKRSEVKDSHDRYANIEVNYLLQRMEAYRGLAILATNQRAALDMAFTRRLRFIVTFPFPAAAERAAMWSKAFPARTPLAVLDIPRLARFNLSGGSIHSIALNAAFMAAEAGTPVTMNILLGAARAEMRKLDKPIIEADFRRLDAAGAGA